MVTGFGRQQWSHAKKSDRFYWSRSINWLQYKPAYRWVDHWQVPDDVKYDEKCRTDLRAHVRASEGQPFWFLENDQIYQHACSKDIFWKCYFKLVLNGIMVCQLLLQYMPGDSISPHRGVTFKGYISRFMVICFHATRSSKDTESNWNLVRLAWLLYITFMWLLLLGGRILSGKHTLILVGVTHLFFLSSRLVGLLILINFYMIAQILGSP